MKNHIKLLAVSFLTLGIASCSDWQDHYEKSNPQTTGQNLFEVLKSNPNTTTFASLAEQAGYAEMLSASQTYTVFAPTNEALADFDAADKEALQRLMKNHIARFLHPTSTSASAKVRMLNGKNYYYKDAGNFAGANISSANKSAGNGIVHEIDTQIPFAYNVYEYMQHNASTSKVYEFIHRFDEIRFDVENSVEIDIDEQGRPVYDSVFVSYNRLLQDKVYGLGHIADEDSLYTMLVPDNTAWDAAYERIHPSFKLFSADEQYADSVQDVRTGIAILSDLIYKGADKQPAECDTLVSTSGSIIRNPGALFGGAENIMASNGMVFGVSNLAYDNAETWNKPISVEAEELNGRTYNNATTGVYTRNISEESLVTGVSGDSYIEVQPLNTSTNPVLTFDIPNVLAGKYNVYAVFLPSTVEGAEMAADSTRIQCILTYTNAKGKSTTKRGTTIMTESREVTKMLCFEEFEFPVSDYTDRLWLSDEKNDATNVETATKLVIQTNVTTSDYTKGKYSRTFRLDRIILEPIKK